MSNISPGVYTKIIDLSTFIQAVPSTIGLICGFSKKGRDNEVLFVGSRAEFISEWGEPNITDYGKNFGQGPYLSYNFLGESGSLYWMRLMSDDATYSNLRIDAQLAAADATASISITYLDSINTKAELKTNLAVDGDVQPLCFLYPIGRGEYYNGISVRLTEYSNPLIYDTYVLDIYEKQSDGDDVIIESFNVSFDPNAKDNGGDSLWIQSILENYSSVLRADMVLNEQNDQYTSGYDLAVRTYDKDIGIVSANITGGSGSLTDNKQDFSDWQKTPESGTSSYMVICKDGKGNTISGWLGASSGVDDETINVFDSRDLDVASQGWNGDIATFDIDSAISYRIKKSSVSIAPTFSSSIPQPLKKGTEGSLINTQGDLDTTEAEILLEQGYSGITDDSILDPESLYFTLVFDAGYPSDVKTAISNLCRTRRDCVGIMDNGDNSSVTIALNTRDTTNKFNTYFVSLYEPFNKISDPFTGADMWVSPVYHMAYILPKNDNVAGLWFAAAGYDVAAIDSIKESRYNPKLGQRDQMYLKQLNPIVNFAQGNVVWSQLTTQAKASSLQDLNVVRLVLYIDRALKEYCRNFIFKQNDEITWGQIAGSIVGFLETIKQNRGLESYTLDVGATRYERKIKTCHVDVTLEPIKALEKIELNFFIK